MKLFFIIIKLREEQRSVRGVIGVGRRWGDRGAGFVQGAAADHGCFGGYTADEVWTVAHFGRNFWCIVDRISFFNGWELWFFFSHVAI